MIYIKVTRYKFIAITIIIAILTLIAVVWYKSIYPFRFAEKIYEENEECLNHIVDYFENYNNIYSAQMNNDGIMQTVTSKGLESFDCTSDVGYKFLLFLREKYIEDNNEEHGNQSYMLNFIKAEYDDDDNMKLEIPVYARILNTDASVDSPNRMVYYLVYSDDNYSGDVISNIKKETVINDNWYVISKSHTPG